VAIHIDRVEKFTEIVAQPHDRDIADRFENIDGFRFPRDTDDAVEPAVGQIADPVFGDHRDSGIGTGERKTDMLGQRVHVAAHHGFVRRLGDQRNLFAADPDARPEAEFPRRRQYPATGFRRDQRAVVEDPADCPGGNFGTVRHLRQHP